MSTDQFTSTTVTTADGKHARSGDRVFNFYDGRWGTILGPIDDQGWFDHVEDSEEHDGRRTCLNGERVAFVVPSSNPHYEAWLAGSGLKAPAAPPSPFEVVAELSYDTETDELELTVVGQPDAVAHQPNTQDGLRLGPDGRFV